MIPFRADHFICGNDSCTSGGAIVRDAGRSSRQLCAVFHDLSHSWRNDLWKEAAAGDHCPGWNDRYEKVSIDWRFLAYVKRVPGEIELRQMRYFLAIAEERSFTRAARRCHVAQPSLSRQIRALENSLGTRVFERLPREIRITPAGKLFEREASQAMEHTRLPPL